jgi:hypothetical protein
LGIGLGAIGATVEAQDSNADKLQITGFVIPVEVAFGGTPAPGIVLGGGFYTIHAPAAHYAVGRGDFAIEETADYGSVGMIGPFLDAYPDPHGGFHIQAAPCLTSVNPGKSDTIVTGDVSGAGFGAMVGLGYEGWVGEQWGIGVLARLQYASVELKDEDDNKYDFKMLVPALLLTATLH